MIQSACERIKELEGELAEVKVAYEGMKSQRDSLADSCRDALSWIKYEVVPTRDEDSLMSSLSYLEKILKEHLK